MAISSLLIVCFTVFVPLGHAATNTVCSIPDQFDAQLKPSGPSSIETCESTVQRLDSAISLFAARDCNLTKGWDHSTNQECDSSSNSSNCQIGSIAKQLKAIGILCCKDKYTVCAKTAPKAANTVCRNPDQYVNTLSGQNSILGQGSCDLAIQTFDYLIDPFYERDCDPNRGWDNANLVDCKAGESGCTVGYTPLLTKSLRLCCKDNWDVCTAVQPKAANTFCANTDQYDGTLMVKLGTSNVTCDAAIAQYAADPNFENRDCDVTKGFDTTTLKECTSGSTCQLGFTQTLATGLKSCCKDELTFCNATASTTASPGAATTAGLSAGTRFPVRAFAESVVILLAALLF